MLNLEQAIAEWRRRMLAAGITTPVPLEELEGHLRDDVEAQTDSGTDAQRAFEAAVRRIGQASAIKAEFAKVCEVMSARSRKVTWILCAVCAVMDVLLGAFLLIMSNLAPEPMAFREQVLGASGWFLFPVILWSWRYTYPFLPVIPGQGMRLAVAVLGSVLGGFCTAILLHFVPAGAGFSVPFFGAVVWAFSPLAIGATLLVGLEEAVYRNIAAPAS